jgi:glucosamine--fructose-6-phosphate aminotransferase (isomerizing)
MCGIFAYVNYGVAKNLKEIVSLLIQGLKRLEYRGYDSAGLSVEGADKNLVIVKKTGHVSALQGAVEIEPAFSASCVKTVCSAIAHTRWATHGEVSDRNAHPQTSQTGDFAVVHNGIMTNFAEVKQFLKGQGKTFRSETDTEVIAALASYLYAKQAECGKAPTFVQLVMEVMDLTHGAYAMVFQSPHYPGQLVACKKGSPLIVGIKREGQETTHLGDDSTTPTQFYFASDISALVDHTKNVVYLEDDDVAAIKDGKLHFFNKARNADFQKMLPELRVVHQVLVELEHLSKGEYKHFMQKEIFEQSESVMNTMRGRINFESLKVSMGGFNDKKELLRTARRLLFISCGTSLNSCLAIRPLFDELVGIPVSVENSSDFIDRRPKVFRDDVCLFVSQSGETADTLRALEYCAQKGATLVGFVNVVGSSISRSTHFGAHLNAGVEIGVASTKAYTSQIVTMSLLALMMCDDTISVAARRQSIIHHLSSLSTDIQTCLKTVDKQVESLARRLKDAKSVLVLGRGYQYATCLEAALKIKELTYIHTEGINSGELKHGPLALIDENIPVIIIATRDGLIDRARSAVQQIRARKCRPIVILSEEDPEIAEHAEEIIRVPATADCLQSIINIIPMQLLAYHLALARGNNVDCPRNLAKSVTTQ